MVQRDTDVLRSIEYKLLSIKDKDAIKKIKIAAIQTIAKWVYMTENCGGYCVSHQIALLYASLVDWRGYYCKVYEVDATVTKHWGAIEMLTMDVYVKLHPMDMKRYRRNQNSNFGCGDYAPFLWDWERIDDEDDESMGDGDEENNNGFYDEQKDSLGIVVKKH